jgi:plasmid maintenance system antidote protein VapI
MDMFNPPHPGDVLREYLPAGMQVTEAATNGHAAISADMALRLEGALGTGASMWVGMQADYDLWQARQRPQPKVKRLAA